MLTGFSSATNKIISIILILCLFHFRTAMIVMLSNKSSRLTYEMISGFYDYRIRQQIFLIVAIVATVVCLAMHVVKRRRQIISAMLVVITTCSCMVGSGRYMYFYTELIL